MRKHKGHMGSRGKIEKLSSSKPPAFAHKAKKPEADDKMIKARPVAHAQYEAKKAARRKKMTNLMI
jgi:hypothetical protein